MGDGTKESPYTREDVLRLIKENGGTAMGLNLSNLKFQDNIDLSGLNLSGIKLNFARLFRANFDGSNLDSAELLGAKLQHATFNPLESKDAEPKNASLQVTGLGDADLTNAEFRQANITAARFQGQQQMTLPTGESMILPQPAFLHGTDFRGANLFLANFKGCYFYGTKLEGAHIRGTDIYEAHLEEVDWGSYITGEETSKEFYFAEHVYRRLKLWYNAAGMYDTGAKFYYREKEANRKSLKWYSRHRWTLEALRLLFAYGEDWKRVFYWMAAFVILFAVAYYFGGKLELLESLYFSAVSFTALGYGKWAVEPIGWVKGLGALEAFVGVFMMALLLVTFVRKWTR
jgi:hypothetical protein